MSLKRKHINHGGSRPNASLLPGLMTQPGEARVTSNLPIDKLQPAPAEWNFFSSLPDGKFLELLDSIRQNGLFHPLVVWRQSNGDTMVLSGHNRLHAYRILYETTHDNRYAFIPCTVMTGIDAEAAHEIVIDSNWVQRNLTPSEKARSIYQKYALAGRKKRSENGVRQSNYDLIAEQYKLSGRQIARYIRLGQLDEKLQTLVDQQRIPLALAIRMTDAPAEIQRYLAERWPDRLRCKQAEALRADMTKEEIDRLLNGEAATVRVSFEVPDGLERRFRRMAVAWLAENTAAENAPEEPAEMPKNADPSEADRPAEAADPSEIVEQAETAGRDETADQPKTNEPADAFASVL